MLLRGIFLLVAMTLGAVRLSAVDDSSVIYPKAISSASAPANSGSGGLGATTVLGALVLAGAGAWMMWRGRGAKLAGRSPQLLSIEETRPLGNRQYLVITSYEGKKFMLGVCPGRIDLLATVSEPAAPGKTG